MARVDFRFARLGSKWERSTHSERRERRILTEGNEGNEGGRERHKFREFTRIGDWRFEISEGVTQRRNDAETQRAGNGRERTQRTQNLTGENGGSGAYRLTLARVFATVTDSCGS